SSDPEGGPLSYAWDFGDGAGFQSGLGSNPTHSYGSPGSKTVSLRVTDDNGASDTASQSITVNEFPTASFTHTPADPVLGEPINFDASGSSDPDGSIASYEWDVDGDGTTDKSGEIVSHTYTSGTSQTVTLTVTDDDGASTSASQTLSLRIRADVDLKTKNINSKKKGVIPVEIRPSEHLDPASDIDVGSLRFGAPSTVDSGGGAAPAHGGHQKGNGSLMLHFPMPDTGLQSGDTQAKLVGETIDGDTLFDTVSVTVK
ncbi:MAG: PKD domain-containing protein, partial [Halobacteriales archaeon]